MANLFKDFKDKCIDFDNYKKYNTNHDLKYNSNSIMKCINTKTKVDIKRIKNPYEIPLKSNTKVLVLKFMTNNKDDNRFYIFSKELEHVYSVYDIDKYVVDN